MLPVVLWAIYAQTHARQAAQKRGGTRRKLVVSIPIPAALAAPALAIFGFGDIVYDPSNFAEAAQELLQLEQQMPSRS